MDGSGGKNIDENTGIKIEKVNNRSLKINFRNALM